MALLQLVSNPSKRRRGRKKTASGKRRKSAKRSTAKRSSRRKSLKFRSNPIRTRGMMNRVVDQQLIPAAKQAAGALAVDVAFGYLGAYIPAQLSTGVLRHVTKAAGAILLSAVASNFVKSSTANEMAKGALTVTLHDAAKEILAGTLPGVPLGFFTSGYVTPPARLGASRRRSLGMYQSASVTDLASARNQRIGIQ